MSTPDIRDSRFAWAYNQLELLEAECSKFLERHPRPYDITADRQTEADRVVDSFNVQVHEQPPTSIAHTLGSVLHGLRSTLDQTVFAVSEAHTGHLTSNVARDIAYPIASRIEDFDTKKLRAVAPKAVTLIEGTQPYHRRVPALHPLAVLKTLSDIDKHRHIHLGYLYFAGAAWNGTAEVVRFNVGPFKEKAEIIAFVSDPANPEMQVDPSLHLVIGPAERGNWESRGIVHILEGIRDYIWREILIPLQPLMDAAPTAQGQLPLQ